MKSLLIPGVAALVVGVAGGTGIRMATAPPLQAAVQAAEPEGTDPAAPDAHSALEDPATDGGDAALSLVSEGTAHSDPSGTIVAHGTDAAPQRTQGTDDSETAPASLPRRSSTGDYKQLSRILGNMKAADAERILEHMTDEQVASILASMGVRPAATLMAAIPPARAAAIGRALAARGSAEAP